MSSYSPARTHSSPPVGRWPEEPLGTSFKSSLLERSLAPLLMLRPYQPAAPATSPRRGRTVFLSALARPLAREEADDLGVVVWRVDVVGPAGSRDHVEQLGPSLQDLSRARVARQGEELLPQLAGEDHRRCPPF